MANRSTGYGMTAELQAKKDSNFDLNLANETREWIELVIGEPLSSWSGQEDITESLKDGIVLCKLINVIKPGSVKKINTSKLAFKMMENIGYFLAGCEAIGIKKVDLFQTVDLYEGTNILQVINGLQALGRKCHTIRPDLPTLGPIESTENKREFTEHQLQASEGVIGLQAGSNKGASRAGTTYGLERQIEKTNLKN